ncbi:VWA domain-containing protein [Moritella dasanensis]|uniref:VWA domain-containing protein n=1 Tax=Moritella dasanensis TaxID=428031 RepID=UPI0002F84D9E|nr:VWA domain-containing protein [Moritella dasanensis]
MYFSIVWQNFHFIRPLWLLAFVPFILFFVMNFRQKKSQEGGLKNFPPHLLAALTVGEQGWKKLLPLKLWGFLVVLAIIIAAGPSWLRQTSPFGEDTAPLVIVLDVSESMLQQDIQPSRLVRAKQKISDLLALREGGSTALVVYAGSAHTAMALTRDNAIFTPLLQAVSPKIMPRKGKFAEYSLANIDTLLAAERSKGNPGSVLLITDGLGSDTKARFVDYFNGSINSNNNISATNSDLNSKQSPPLLLVLGVGNNEQAVSVPFDADGLKSLAKSASGYYHSISTDNSDVEWIQDNIQQFMLLSNDNAQPWADMGYNLVFLLALLFLLWFRRGWTINWSLQSVLLLFALTYFPAPPVLANVASEQMTNSVKEGLQPQWRFADLWMTADQQGQYYFNRGNYAQAAVRFDDLMWKASAYYFAEEFDLARRYFMRVDNPVARFGAASALAQSREYIAARNLFKQIVKENPDYLQAAHNLVIVQKIIDDINRMSESQTDNENEASKELGDQPQTSDGAEKMMREEQLIKESYNAEQLLQDEALSQAWMKRVQGDPERFLMTKFSQQLQMEGRP